MFLAISSSTQVEMFKGDEESAEPCKNPIFEITVGHSKGVRSIQEAA